MALSLSQFAVSSNSAGASDGDDSAIKESNLQFNLMASSSSQLAVSSSSAVASNGDYCTTQDRQKQNDDLDIEILQQLVNEIIEECQQTPQVSVLEDVQKFNNTLMKLFNEVSRPASSVEIVSFTGCCKMNCTMFLSRFLIDHLRCAIPLEKDAMKEFQFHLIKQFVVNDEFHPVVASRDVCETVFASIYCLTDHRLKTMLEQIKQGYSQSALHGNVGISVRSPQYYERMAKLVVLLEEHAQDLPNKSGYIMGRGITKKDLMQLASPESKHPLLPQYYLSGIKPPLHWRTSNDLTKCKYCSVFRCCLQHKKKIVNKEEVRKHRENHWKNVNADRLDYYLRNAFSRDQPEILLSMTHDGMSKHKTKLPHLLWNRAKFIGDADLAFCNLNGVIIHRKGGEREDFIVDGYFNLGDIFPGGANAVISQLIVSIVKTAPLPSVVALQLDNCSVNKCYSMIASLGWLLLVQKSVKEFYICFNEVGHTHIDIDALFGRFSQALSRNECLTPEDLLELFKQQKGVRQASANLTVYDFAAFLSPYQNNFGKLKNNHMFHVYKDSANVPKVQVAPYIRSSKWLKGVPDGEKWDLDVFAELPPTLAEPQALLPSMDKLQKVIHAAKMASQLLSEEEIKVYTSFVAEMQSYEPVPFSQVLALLVTSCEDSDGHAAASNVLLDPHNEEIENFINQNKEQVAKIWEKIQNQSNETMESSSNAEPTPAEGPVPQISQQNEVSDSALVTVEPETAPSAPAAKKRGRPRKNQAQSEGQAGVLPANIAAAPKKNGRKKNVNPSTQAQTEALQSTSESIPSSSSRITLKKRKLS